MRDFPVAAIADVLGKQHVLPPGVRAITSKLRLCGPVVTCQGPDVSVRRAAIDLAQPGDIVVVAAQGVIDRACFGAKTAEHMMSLGLVGIVVDGAVRDVADLATLRFPTYARGVTPRNFDYPVDLQRGAVNVPVRIAEHPVEPGDVVCADDDGVVIIPRERVAGLAPRVAATVAAEDQKWAARHGKRFDAVEKLREQGYRIVAGSELPA